MNTSELQLALDKLGVQSNKYSLDGIFLPDAIILISMGYQKEVIYMDERGRKESFGIFDNESLACQFIYNLFQDSVDVAERFGLET